MKIAIIVFPGTNCDAETHHAIQDVLGVSAEYVWHDAVTLDGFDAIILPGGFSYGDYVRCGAVAGLCGVIPAVKAAALAGVPVLGIGNGFQILTEIGLLPGGFLQNASTKFVCGMASLTVENNATMFTNTYDAGETISVPVAHGFGNYYADAATIETLKAQGRIVFTYQNNPNGSAANIAGIVNERGNVLGMMPHPERAVDLLVGSADGAGVFRAVFAAWREKQ